MVNHIVRIVSRMLRLSEIKNQMPANCNGLSDADARFGRLCGRLSSSSDSELHGDSYGVLTRFMEDEPSVFGDNDRLMSGEPLGRCLSTWPKTVDGRKGSSPASSLRMKKASEIAVHPGTKLTHKPSSSSRSPSTLLSTSSSPYRRFCSISHFLRSSSRWRATCIA